MGMEEELQECPDAYDKNNTRCQNCNWVAMCMGLEWDWRRATE